MKVHLHYTSALAQLRRGDADVLSAYHQADAVKLEITDDDGNPMDTGLVQKLSFTIDANDMLPRMTLEFIPSEIVVTGDIDPEFKPITLFVGTDKDSNGTEFSKQFALTDSSPIFVKPTEQTDGKVD